MRSRKQNRGTKNSKKKDSNALLRKKTMKKAKKATQIVRPQLLHNDSITSRTRSQKRKRDYVESCNKNNESYDSTECIGDFVIPGDIPDLHSLYICRNELFSEFFPTGELISN